MIHRYQKRFALYFKNPVANPNTKIKDLQKFDLVDKSNFYKSKILTYNK